MTKTEAIKLLKEDKALYETDCSHAGDGSPDGDLLEALDMAIQALEQERPEIIRCKNCRHNNNCEIQFDAQAGSEFFCGSAERRE